MSTATIRTESNKIEKNRYAGKIMFIGGFFFIFGFVTWLNGTLIPYLRIACELQEWESYLVTFAFYIAYTVMAIPSGKLLTRTGMVKGMQIGLLIMAVGCLMFIPSALTRIYGLFLLGLFIVGTGLTVLQTAVNPYITLLGPAESAAQRISIMGVCNKLAGISAPLVLGVMILGNSDELLASLKGLSSSARAERLDELARAVILPYCILAAALTLISFAIKFAKLPEIKSVADTSKKSLAIWKTAPMILGFFAIFTSVGTEVVSGDTIGNYGMYHGMRLDVAKNLTSYSLASGIAGYLFGVFTIPKYISQERAYLYSNILGVLITLLVMFTNGISSIVFVALLNLANALLWPAVWPQALRGLKGTVVNTASGILIMGIAGGAIMPLLYGWAARINGNNQIAYWVLLPCYIFNMYYWWIGRTHSASTK
ncbi:MAG: sugar MFS transporter [Chitinophagaceae bacterium]|nr:sugar MFS transporter [Chitinophagaceae bacterium]